MVGMICVIYGQWCRPLGEVALRQETYHKEGKTDVQLERSARLLVLGI